MPEHRWTLLSAWTVKIGEKGQFVIPKEAREMFDLHPGDSIIVLADQKRGIAIPPKTLFSQLMRSIFEPSSGEEEEPEKPGTKKE